MKPSKSVLRSQLRKKRIALTKNARKQAERQVGRFLSRHIKRGAKIGAYWAVGSELSLHKWFQTALKRGAIIYLPYIEHSQKRLWFTPLPKQSTQAKHQSNHLNIPQFHGQKIRAHRLDILLVPLVGIDQNGYRLGQGGGFYDTTIHHLKHRRHPKLIGIGFDCQLIQSIPTESHDQPLPRFISEKGEYNFQPIQS